MKKIAQKLPKEALNYQTFGGENSVGGMVSLVVSLEPKIL